ncbi:MAG: beta-glucosidase BglX [Proteobacteria bacterium]|nr:beta-glucosidase BglX [Pseudomonadota bacterium]
MSLEEKAGQLSIFADGTRSNNPNINPAAAKQGIEEVKEQIRKGTLGSLFSAKGAEGAREYQRVAIEESKSKVPLIFAADIIHGCETQFPIPLGEASSFDLDLCERTAKMAAFEATAVGIQWTFAPMVDVARDQRWGRVAEGAGEDTYLGNQIARARIKGFQGGDLTSETTVLACPKHYAAYGAVQGGMDYNTSDIPETTLRDVHLPPFKAAFDAGALSTMTSFNDINGVPSTGNHHLLTDILRDEWGFKGLVVSDYTADEEMIKHGYAKDGRDAAKKSIIAGCDISMQSHLYNLHLPDLVKSGEVPMEVVDESVRRVLYVKKQLGLFENPYRSLDPKREKTDIRTPKAIALSREAARKSAVLLKNDNNILPMKKSGQKIALIGPLANDKYQTLGTWAIFPDYDNAVTLEKGLRNQISNQSLIKSVKGCEIEKPISGGIQKAVEAAKWADVVILAIGEKQEMSGEAQSRVEITIPKPQQDLAEAIAKTGKPVIIILSHGRALALSGAVKDANAIMCAWFLGSEHGNGLADLIFGDYSPQGRLPVSFPVYSGQQPYYYNHRPTGRPQGPKDERFYKARYIETDNVALYSFGHGLSYSKIEYSKPNLSAKTLNFTNSIRASATITNKGKRTVKEVVQLYINDNVASLTRPVRELKGFKLIELAPGESKEVSFEISATDLAFINHDLQRRAEKGGFTLWIAPSSVTGEAVGFELV